MSFRSARSVYRSHSQRPRLPPVIQPAEAPYITELALGEVLATIDVAQPGGTVETLTVSLSATVPMDLDPVVNGYMIGFDATFGVNQYIDGLVGR